MVVIVMGVAGSGKTTVGRELAARVGAAFVEGDDLHPESNVGKMARGEPLTDADRAPWIDALCERMAEASRAGRGLVVTCSALRRSHRQRLRGAGEDVRFVWLDAPVETLRARLEARERAGEHFMGARMLASQLEAFEPPTDEADVARVASCAPPGRVAMTAAEALKVE